jgi:hypothetical protein
MMKCRRMERCSTRVHIGGACIGIPAESVAAVVEVGEVGRLASNH